MIKTEMMKRYEEETGEILDIDHLSADANGSWYGYIEELEAELRGLKILNKWSKKELIQYQAKADAYDRLMSGGKKTLKEVANFYGLPIALSSHGDWLVFHDKPWASDYDWFSDCLKFGELPRIIHNLDIDFNGDWKDSLALPDGWEEAK